MPLSSQTFTKTARTWPLGRFLGLGQVKNCSFQFLGFFFTRQSGNSLWRSRSSWYILPRDDQSFFTGFLLYWNTNYLSWKQCFYSDIYLAESNSICLSDFEIYNLHWRIVEFVCTIMLSRDRWIVNISFADMCIVYIKPIGAVRFVESFYRMAFVTDRRCLICGMSYRFHEPMNAPRFSNPSESALCLTWMDIRRFVASKLFRYVYYLSSLSSFFYTSLSCETYQSLHRVIHIHNASLAFPIEANNIYRTLRFERRNPGICISNKLRRLFYSYPSNEVEDDSRVLRASRSERSSRH